MYHVSTQGVDERMINVHYVCMLVQRFEPQGRRFTNSINIIIIILSEPRL